MADVFLSYSRSDQERVARVADGLENGGRSLWWDRRLASGGDYALEIEREIDAARCVVVAWSPAARDSLWVRAEANAALDSGKLVQIAYDAPRLPLPFTMLHFLDFTAWSGASEAMPWPRLEQEIANRFDGGENGQTPRLASAQPALVGPEPALQGLGRIAALGWAALGVAIAVAVSTLLVAGGLVGAGTYAVLSLAALVASAGLLAVCAFLVLRISRASRR